VSGRAFPWLVVLLATQAHAAENLATDARAEIREVLARPEFQPLADADKLPRIPKVELGWIETLLQVLSDIFGGVLEAIAGFFGSILQRLFRGIGQLFNGLGGSGASGSAGVFATFATWALVVLGVALIVWLLWRLMESRRSERHAGIRALSVTETGAGEDDALARTPEDWRRRAERLAGQGDRVEALRSLYLELLAGLHRAGAIDYDRTRTNTAYVFDLARAHPARAPFLSLTGRFDRAVYGAHEPSAADVQDAMEEMGRVRDAFVREVSGA